MKQFFASLLAAAMLPTFALADVSWPATLTPAQQELQDYISLVDEQLVTHNEQEINQLFELYSSFATMAITSTSMADMPEDVELGFTMDAEGLYQLVLRVSDVSRFPVIAASCVQAANPAMKWDDALAQATSYAKRVQKSPDDSFEDDIIPMRADHLQVFYAYEPNAYQDGVNWLTMTLIFPLSGFEENGLAVTPTPAPDKGPGSDDNPNYEGFVVGDGYSHFEVFVTESPSPEDGITW